MRVLSASSSSSTTAGQPDLTHLFRLAAHEAKKSRLQGRILRVVSPFIIKIKDAEKENVIQIFNGFQC